MRCEKQATMTAEEEEKKEEEVEKTLRGQYTKARWRVKQLARWGLVDKKRKEKKKIKMN